MYTRQQIRAKLLIIGVLTFLISTFCVVTGLSQPPQTRAAFPAYFLHINDNPNNGAPSWGEANREVQGITHDDDYWYITSTDITAIPQNCPPCRVPPCPPCPPRYVKDSYLWKIPVSVNIDQDLASYEQLPTDDPRHVSSVHMLQFPEIATANLDDGFNHWGDLDYCRGYLVVPTTSSGRVLPSTAVVIFRAIDLSPVGFGRLPGEGPTNPQKSVGWCAVDPTNGNIVSSSDGDIDPPDPENTKVLFRYRFNWDALLNWDALPSTDYLGQFPEDWLTWIDTHPLLDAGGAPLNGPSLLKNMQGGEFAPSGELLYITSGSGTCAQIGPGEFATDGIHVFETVNWREIKRSTNHDWDAIGYPRVDPPSSFDYHYDSECGLFEDDAHSPEGLTIWDLDDGRAPYIMGQLHVLVADVSAGFLSGGNRASLENFGARLYVDELIGTDTPTWADPLLGTPAGPPIYGRPFKFVTDAVNWYPAWYGAQIAIMVPGSTVPSIMTMQDVVVYEIGSVPSTMQQGQPFPDLNLRLYNFSSPPVSGALSIDFFLSPDPVAPGSPATDNDVDLGVLSVNAQLGRGEYQSVVVSGVKIPCDLPPGSYYLGTSVNGGPASSSSNPILIDIKADTTPPDLQCPGDLTVECSIARGTPRDDSQLTPFFDGVTARDDCGATITNDSPSLFPLGITRVTFVATDSHGNSSQCTANVTVEDTTPPVIVTSKQEIVFWPPDHKYRTINAQDFIASVTDVCDDSIGIGSIRVLSVASDEVEDALGEGDGSTLQDAIITCPNTVQVRAEREGASNGRVYRVTYAATDHSGNRATVVCKVHVPHDKSEGTAIEGPGLGYVEYGSCDVLRQIPLDSDPAALDLDHGFQPTTLLQNYPNPFNPRTRIEFSLQQSVFVSLKVYNVRGEVVASLVSEQLPAGDYSFEWDAAGLPSGVYLSRLEAGAFTQSKKFLLLK